MSKEPYATESYPRLVKVAAYVKKGPCLPGELG
jgi:hypothetical protein